MDLINRQSRHEKLEAFLCFITLVHPSLARSGPLGFGNPIDLPNMSGQLPLLTVKDATESWCPEVVSVERHPLIGEGTECHPDSQELLVMLDYMWCIVTVEFQP